jgi:hypothetical protein
MVTAARLDYESLPFLNVFSPEYTKDPLAAIRALGEGQAMARSPSLPATRRRWKARSTDDKGACLRRSLARRQSNERAGSHDASSRNCSMA